MTRDDLMAFSIIRMAREAGCGWTRNGTEPLLAGEAQIQKFAELVAAAEREACAMEADYEAARWSYAPEAREPCEEIAKAIRARSRA